MDIGNSKIKLVRAAIDLFYLNGFEETTFRQIGTRVGSSQPAVYKHFKNKMDLLVACSQFVAQEAVKIVEPYIDQKRSADQRLLGYIRGHFEWIKKHTPEASCVLSLYYFASCNDEALRSYRLMELAACERIANLLAQGNFENRWSVRDPQNVARFIHSALVGDLIKYLHTARKSSPAATANLLWRNVAKAL